MSLIGITMGDDFFPENELASATRSLATVIEDARSEAITSGRVVFFELSLGETERDRQHVRSIKEPRPDEARDAEELEFVLTVREWAPLPRDVRIDSVIVGDTEPWTEGIVSIPIQPDGTMPSHLIRLWSPAVDPGKDRHAGWACIQVAGLLGQARVLNRFVEPEFLTEDAF